MAASIYEALPQDPGSDYIRVCELQPGTRDEPLQIELRTLCISSPGAQRYEAISWVWGSPSDSTTLNYRGQIIPIRQNLEHALRVFRYTDKPRALWADAICINQEDQDEKSAQVAMMGAIYSHAVEVLVWLGDDPEQHSAIVFDEMKRNGLVLVSEGYMMSWSARLWQSINAFYANPWFTRVWVQQEIGLAKNSTFHWGPSMVSRRILSMFHLSIIQGSSDDRIRSLLSQSITLVSTTLGVRDWGSFPSAAIRLSFPMLLYTYRNLVATDPRDYIFGMLSHPSAKNLGSRTNLLITPDYSKAVESVYLDVMKTMLVDPRSTGLHPLLLIHHTDVTLMADVPSWVAWLHHPSETSPEQDNRAEPKFSHGRWKIPPPNVLLAVANDPCNAGGSFGVDFHIQDHRLIIDGTIFDRIEGIWMDPKQKLLALWIAYLLESNNVSTVPTELMDRLGDALPTVTRWLRATPYEDTVFAAASTLTCGQTYYDGKCLKPSEKPDVFKKDFLHCLSQEIGLSIQRSSPTDHGPFCDILSFSTLADANCYARAFTRTEKGFFGLVPTIAVQGDCIAVFSGVKDPYVLRPVSDGVYKIVGHCYVQGIMYGEAIHAMQERGETTTNLVII